MIGYVPVPQTPDAVILTKTLSPTSWSGLVVVLFFGMPSCWPLKTVKVGIIASMIVAPGKPLGQWTKYGRIGFLLYVL